MTGGDMVKCPYCGAAAHGNLSPLACPLVGAVEYHPDGAVKRVEKMRGEWGGFASGDFKSVSLFDQIFGKNR